MRRFITAVKHFFFPPPDSPRWLRVLPFAILGVLTLGAFAGGAEVWAYTNSPEFCGSSCHTMPPEYSAYLRSPHARVQCVECHLGRDVFRTQFTRKAGDLRHVVRTITEDYTFPIRAHEMRPATDSCERCHFPEKFSDDSLRELRNYLSDQPNTPQSIFLIMKTGGGSARQGLGRGIHWHIENEVYFLATDELEQEIPYVRVVDAGGSITEYYDVASGITPNDVAGTHLEQMDCITCHNRVTHTIPSPEEAVDQAIVKGLISTELPYARREAVSRLQASYADDAAARAAFSSLLTFYEREFPETYQTKRAEILRSITVLNDIYRQSVYPEQKIDWYTHPDNLGHKDFPGCFRCHDGKHLSGTGEAIRLECNVCHSIPVLADNATLVTSIELARGPEPPSHTHSSWITLHGKAIDASCAACHTPADPSIDYLALEGKPPPSDSFCGNVACHANEWIFTGFNSPELIPYLERQVYLLKNTSPYLLDGAARTYDGTFRAMLDGRCVTCHGGDDPEGGLDMSRYSLLLAGGAGGPVIVPGDPAASLLVQRQSGPSDHFGQLLVEELEAVSAWIAAGAPER